MPLPQLAKTWQFNVNNPNPSLGSATANCKRLIRSIKNALTGFASSPWVVVSSCNGVMTSIGDLWVSDADIVCAVANRSWIVLRQTGIAANFEICIDMNNADGRRATVVVSPSAGFSGGAINARPTAPDEVVTLNSAAWCHPTMGDVPVRWSVMQSSDGECTRILTCTSGVTSTFAMFDKPANPVTGWGDPSLWYWLSGTGVVLYANFFTSFLGKVVIGGTPGTTAMLQEGRNAILFSQDTLAGLFANEVSGEWPMQPLGIVCNTVGIRGRHGSFYDLWAGSSTLPAGDTYPDDGSNQFVQLGILIVPWNGGPVNLS